MKWFSVKRLLQVMGSLCGLGLASAMTGSVVAEEGTTRWLRNGPELVRACRDERSGVSQRQDGLCTSYLLGYLDGNAATASDNTVPSAFMQNVLRTRAPSHPRIKALKSVVYCLDGTEDLSMAIAALEPESVATQTSAQIIVAILERDHRCRT